ncbi:PxKF domain-containing protein, partial [Deinococcus frigens]
VTAIAAGQYHSLALKSDGSVVGWGDNYYGQATSPAGLTGVTAIAAGGRHSLALFTPTDSTPPVITATPSPATPNGAGGWYTTPVTVSWSVTDSESAVSSSSGCDSTTISSDTTGQTLTCTATSGGGTASSPVTIKLDVVKPTLSPVLSSSVPVLLGASLSATPNATDATSGVATATCGPAETSSVGSKTLTCTATDVAGNTATTAVPYSVIYNFHGFTKSLANFPLLNTARTGSAVPINFDLGGVTSLDVLAAGYPKVTPVGCATTAAVPENATSFSAASVAGLTYSATTGTYSYVWKTGSTPGCYQFNLKLRDGTNHYALVKLR